MKKGFFLFGMVCFVSVFFCGGCEEVVLKTGGFSSEWSFGVDRVWIGPEYWANPLQDWRITQGRIECVGSGGDRNVYLLTRELRKGGGDLKMGVRIGQLKRSAKTEAGWVGFKIGVRGDFDDYRDSAVRGQGFQAGVTTEGQLFVGKLTESDAKIVKDLDNIELQVTAEAVEDSYKITLKALDVAGNILGQTVGEDIDGDWLVGGVCLVCSRGKVVDTPDKRPNVTYGNWGFRPGTARGGNVRFWFADWKLTGSKVVEKDEQAFGPILFAQHTLSKGVMKMTAQMPPVGISDSQVVELQVKKEGRWDRLGKARIDKLARTATFEIAGWDGSIDTPYRLIYSLANWDGQIKRHFFRGTVRKDPVDKAEIVVAGFTGNNDLGFPNKDIVNSVAFHRPDLLFFSGDQIYEGVGGYGVQVNPVEKAAIDYLRKWYLYGWAYRELLRDIPAVSIPDDHDVYHGNIWGAGGKATIAKGSGAERQDSGGYKMPAEWVNLVQRTQTSHLPDPYDATPVEQGIGVYYCDMNYGGVSFGIVEDRKFKSAPKMLLPDAKISNGWPQNLEYDVIAKADVPEAKLLGDRQLDFLEAWAGDWSNGAWMKVVLSQTIFANVATLPADEHSDAAVPKLRILNADEYPADDVPVRDFDTNSWPQTGRNEALKRMRKGFAFHVAGDQHLGSMIRYGVDDYNDAGYAFCVPAVSNVWPRRWYPKDGGANRKDGDPKYTGDFEDGFGNKITVHAVSNPVFTGLKPANLYDRATGYGIVRFDRASRDVTVECWPRLSDPAKSDAKQYPGWPVRLNQFDNYDREAFGFLPVLKVSGMSDPVVEIIAQVDGEKVYTVRIKGTSFHAKVFADGLYTVKVGEPGTEKMRVFEDVEVSREADSSKIIEVDFEKN